MANTKTSRSGSLADQLEAALEGFTRVVESLTSDQWRMGGRNTPGQRINDEDAARPLGVTAHRVAVSHNLVMGRIRWVRHAKPTPSLDNKQINAKHANEYADTTKAEVLSVLRISGEQIVKDLRAIRDAAWDGAREFPTGTMTVEQRIERVLIGHITGHQGSIEATIA